MKKIKCKCGYEWLYKGKLGYATCPSCQKKVKIKAKAESEQIRKKEEK